MFAPNILELMDEDESDSPELKKKKIVGQKKIEIEHSSLCYSSITAPPIVAYKSIESYCEQKSGNSPASVLTPLKLSLNDVQSVGSPIVFKTPRTQVKHKVLAETAMPYVWFSIEELSAVRSLENWTNKKVCPVGLVSIDIAADKCSLNSVCEMGAWTLALDTSLLAELPKHQQLLQVYGTLEIYNTQPIVKVLFTTKLSLADLPLLIESYKLMKEHVPIEYIESKENIKPGEKSNSYTNLEMNDTLDDCSFLL